MYTFIFYQTRRKNITSRRLHYTHRYNLIYDVNYFCFVVHCSLPCSYVHLSIRPFSKKDETSMLKRVMWWYFKGRYSEKYSVSSSVDSRKIVGPLPLIFTTEEVHSSTNKGSQFCLNFQLIKNVHGTIRMIDSQKRNSQAYRTSLQGQNVKYVLSAFQKRSYASCGIGAI